MCGDEITEKHSRAAEMSGLSSYYTTISHQWEINTVIEHEVRPFRSLFSSARVETDRRRFVL